MLDGIDDAYRGILEPVLKRHRKGLARLDRLMQAGNTEAAHALWRKSGIVDDLANAVAQAGAVSAGVIRSGLHRIREEVHHLDQG